MTPDQWRALTAVEREAFVAEVDAIRRAKP